MKWITLTLTASLLATSLSCASQQEAAPAEASNAEITNNQEAGVDEGGIVKNIGDHLVVLRKGMLYAVNVAESGEMRQDDAIRVAPDEALNESVWYDEMLVRGNDVYVVGYRYGARIEEAGWHFWSGWTRVGATEIDHFVLNDRGELEREETVFFESNDYYDTSNYASRMIGDRFVFYIPFLARDDGRIPHLLEWNGGSNFRRVAPLYRKKDVVRLKDSRGHSNVRHTVVSCSVARQQLSDCSAKALDGQWWTTRYVTSEDVFLWAGDRVIAFSLIDGSISAHSARGHVRDRFSFDWDGETLRVLTRQSTRLELMELPRDRFDGRGVQPLERHVRVVAEYEGYQYPQQNRFVGDWLLVATEENRASQLLAYRLSDGARRTLDLGNAWVSRIEPMYGVGALVAAQLRTEKGWRHLGLRLVSITLDDDAQVASQLDLGSVVEGENRSHAFFFKPRTDGGGTFGLPVVGTGGGSGWWGTSVSNIAFLDVTEHGRLALYGAVSASDEDGSSCETSCVDWYGNTRPIFLRDRVYALMGSEIVEVSLRGEAPNVIQRLLLRS